MFCCPLLCYYWGQVKQIRLKRCLIYIFLWKKFLVSWKLLDVMLFDKFCWHFWYYIIIYHIIIHFILFIILYLVLEIAVMFQSELSGGDSWRLILRQRILSTNQRFQTSTCMKRCNNGAQSSVRQTARCREVYPSCEPTSS